MSSDKRNNLQLGLELTMLFLIGGIILTLFGIVMPLSLAIAFGFIFAFVSGMARQWYIDVRDELNYEDYGKHGER